MITAKNSIYTDKLNSLLKVLPDLKARKAYLLNQSNVSTRLKKANVNYRRNLNNIGAYTHSGFSNTQVSRNQSKTERKIITRSHSVDLLREKALVKRDNLIFELKAERNRITTLANQIREADQNQ